MKKTLNYQVTEYDCGKATLENAFSYLFEREEITPEIIKLISTYTLDCYDENGNIGQGGTSKDAMVMLCKKLNEYSKVKKLPLFTNHYTKGEITKGIIEATLRYGGCIVYRTFLQGEHYVLLTKIDNNYIYMWDPYYLENYIGIAEIIFDQPFRYNRRILLDNFYEINNKDFSIGEIDGRECLILYRTK